VQEGSSIAWEGRKITGGKQHGELLFQEAYLDFEDKNVVGGKFVVDMNSMTDNGSGVADHLKNEDFFETNTYPTATFEITEVITDELPRLEARGNMTIKGVTHPMDIRMIVAPDFSRAGYVTITTQLNLDRTLWGITYKSKSVLGDLADGVIEDLMEINVGVVLKIDDK